MYWSEPGDANVTTVVMVDNAGIVTSVGRLA